MRLPLPPRTRVDGPDVDDAVAAARVDEALAAPAHRLDAVRVARQREGERARARVPDAHRLVLARAREELAREAGRAAALVQRLPRQRRHPRLVPRQRRARLLAGLGVPHAHLGGHAKRGCTPATAAPPHSGCVRTSPDLSADANRFPSGDHAVHRTWCRCPAHTNRAAKQLASQNVTVASPPPEARVAPSGLQASARTQLETHRRPPGTTRPQPHLNETCSTASVCPGRLSVHRVTGATRNTASGWKRTQWTSSPESACLDSEPARSARISSSLR